MKCIWGSRHVTPGKERLNAHMLTHKLRITQNDLTASSQAPQIKRSARNKHVTGGDNYQDRKLICNYLITNYVFVCHFSKQKRENVNGFGRIRCFSLSCTMVKINNSGFCNLKTSPRALGNWHFHNSLTLDQMINARIKKKKKKDSAHINW